MQVMCICLQAVYSLKSNRNIYYCERKRGFTKEMKNEGYTILAPQMSPIHFEILEPVCKKHGYNIEVLDNDNRNAIDVGLQYVNNDACFPSITVVGQIMDAVLSGKYDMTKTAIIITQTGGGCRASNYIGFIRRALEKCGLSQVPVISLNMVGLEKNPGFKFTPKLIQRALYALEFGDIFMRCVYRVRPYELLPGSANAMHEKWKKICIDFLTQDKSLLSHNTYRKLCREIIRDFDNLPMTDVKKPRVGVVGEILVKYHPDANNYIVDIIEKEGGEAVVLDLIDFFLYGMYSKKFNYEKLSGSYKQYKLNAIGISDKYNGNALHNCSSIHIDSGTKWYGK